MSEYKRQIALALSIALVAGLGITAIAYNYLPSGGQTTTIITTTIVQQSRTLPQPSFPNELPNMTLDSTLLVNITNPVLMYGNATEVAQWASSLLGEGEVTLQSEIEPHGANNTILAYQATYGFTTATGSQVDLTYLYGQFYELDYRVSGTAVNPPVISNATQFADRLLSGPNSPLQNFTFQTQTSHPGTNFTDFQLTQILGSLPVNGTLANNFDGSHYIEQSSVNLLLGPKGNELNRLFLFSPYWYSVPQDFPMMIPPSQAAGAALTAISSLNSGGTFVANVGFAVVNGHLYYLVTAGNFEVSYYVFVNPRTGEAGFPVQ